MPLGGPWETGRIAPHPGQVSALGLVLLPNPLLQLGSTKDNGLSLREGCRGTSPREQGQVEPGPQSTEQLQLDSGAPRNVSL